MDVVIMLFTTPTGWIAILLTALGLFLIFRRVPPKSPSVPNLRAATAAVRVPPIPPGIRLVTQPLLSEMEAALYNMMRIAVQDQFLLFAQVPVWCLLEIKAEDPKQRAALLKEIAFRRLQFVLVHPGTLQVARVVEIDDPKETSPQKDARDRLLDEVFERVRIPIVRLNKEVEYSIGALAGLLGVEPASLEDP
jgi:hypothetical protein